MKVLFDFYKDQYESVFRVAEYEFEIKIWKFKRAYI